MQPSCCAVLVCPLTHNHHCAAVPPLTVRMRRPGGSHHLSRCSGGSPRCRAKSSQYLLGLLSRGRDIHSGSLHFLFLKPLPTTMFRYQMTPGMSSPLLSLRERLLLLPCQKINLGTLRHQSQAPLLMWHSSRGRFRERVFESTASCAHLCSRL